MVADNKCIVLDFHKVILRGCLLRLNARRLSVFLVRSPVIVCIILRQAVLLPKRRLSA
jgi:hypothetical protein